jgi:tRNA C32,U32 (ribose-2'-O)-methylase TrmJ
VTPMTGAGTNRTKESRGGGPAMILVRPQLAVNIGMCARAMANFGLTDLRLVSPREGWPRSGACRKGAHAAAAGAAHLLEAAAHFETLEDAVRDLNFVWATTARERGQHKQILTPAEAMPECARKIANGEKLGVLFGPERTGLANDEVALADAIITFPVNPAYASLNLAQAVLLTGYEWAPRPMPGRRSPWSSARPPRHAKWYWLFSLISKANSNAPASSVPPANSRSCGATCVICSTACNSPSRTCAPCAAWSCASLKGRGPVPRRTNYPREARHDR